VVATQPPAAIQVSTSVDLPLSHHAKRVLAYASEESERLEHRHIDLVHLSLGLLRDPTASAILIAHGVTRDKVFMYAMTTMPHEKDAGARFRVSELVRSFPPELLAQAEQALRAVLTLNAAGTDTGADSDTQRRRMRVDDIGSVVETSRHFYGRDVIITETLASGNESGTMEYSATVRAFGQQRSWRTSFRI
jgi:hypothetical protein